MAISLVSLFALGMVTSFGSLESTSTDMPLFCSSVRLIAAAAGFSGPTEALWARRQLGWR